MPRMKDAATAAKNWASGMQQASQAYRDGVNNCDVDPMAKAADASESYLRGCNDGNAKRVAKLRTVTKEQWQRACVDKGAARLGSGASASLPRMQQVMTRLLPFAESLRSSLPPRGTFEMNMARTEAWARGMKKFKETSF